MSTEEKKEVNELTPGEPFAEGSIPEAKDLPELGPDEPGVEGEYQGEAVPHQDPGVTGEAELLGMLGLKPGEVTFHDFEFNEESKGTDLPKLSDHPLVAAVGRVFVIAKHPRPDDWLLNVSERFVTDPAMMRNLINHILIKHLRRLDIRPVDPIDTFHVRRYIGSDMGVEEWLITLETVVIPFMVKHDIPPAPAVLNEPVAPTADLAD